MRFAYIDSNGNEVPIPSVDALALRIELGAISESTQLYDAQADQWGPAHTHEIFHTLTRAAEEGDEGFVAPLPPLPSAEAPEPEPEVAEPEARAEPSAEPEEEDESLGLTLADALPEPDEEDEDEGEDTDLPLLGDTDLPLLEDDSGSEVIEEAPGAAFDFGDMEGGLEMAPSSKDEGDEPAMDFGMGLEQPMEFSSSGAGDSGGLNLEQPMSEFTTESPPGWMEPEIEAAEEEDVMDFSSISSDTVATAPAGEPRPKRAAKDRPSRPKFKRRRNMVGPIVGVVTLAALGVGGYVLWPIVQARLADDGQPVEPQVRLPPLSDDLLAPMREVAASAIAAAVTDARSGVGAGSPRPPQEWLSGVYLANASSYEGVETFWSGIRDQLEAARDVDLAAFHDAYARGLAASGVAADQRDAMAERADAGFMATRDGRDAVFEAAERVVNASLGLHSFLVANEDHIQHAPASVVTSDPVLEVKPDTPELAAAMSERIDRALRALDELGALDVVTAQGFWAALVSRLQEVQLP